MSEETAERNGRGKHPQIDHDIRRLIVSGRWKPGQKIPTWDELEVRFDVARGTIMRAMDALKADGFVESRGRRRGMVVAHQPPHLHQYGLVFPFWPEDKRRWSLFCDAVRREAEKAAAATGHRIQIYHGVHQSPERPEVLRLLRDIQGRCMAGVILDECLVEVAHKIVGEAPWLPRVAIGWPISVKGVPVLTLGVERIIQRALDYLAGKQRRRVALLVASGHPSDPTNAPWREEVAKRGLTTRDGWHLYVPPYATTWAANATSLLFSADQGQRPDGLIIADDHLVEQATRGIAAAGVSVPRDLDIVAVCNYPWPPPSAVPVKRLCNDCTAIARTCIQYLQQQQRGEQSPATTEFLPVFEEELTGA